MASNEEKTPDFVLVVKEDNLPHIDQYLNNLKELGLDFESVKGQTIDLIFVKVYISDATLQYFSHLYDVGTEGSDLTAAFYLEPVFDTPFPNPLEPKNEFELFQNRKLTDSEKILIISKILQNAKYGEKDKEYGLNKLIRLNIIETAYPLHDGQATETGTNTRSQLYCFWSNTSVMHMQQPLDLICRYFGHEVAFYFAWLEYFNIMLAIPAVLGALSFLLSLIYLVFGDPPEVREVCINQDVLCPDCDGKKDCKFPSINKFCSLAQWTYVFDNNFTFSYAIFMSFWITLFVTIWRRKENKLKMRWNCVNDIRETEIRQTYLDKAIHQRVNRVSGEIESYTPRVQTVFHYSCTLLACALLFGMLICIVLVHMVLVIMFLRFCAHSESNYLQKNGKVLAMFLGSLVRVCCIKLFQKVYRPASMNLTKFENPRTQFDFDNSVLYKRYLLAFMNNYTPVFYLAFLKGKFITLPHDMTFLRKDACQPFNCIVALCVQLTFILTIKTLLGNVYSAIVPELKKYLRFLKWFFWRKKIKKEPVKDTMPQWEEEYYLEPLFRYSVTKEFSEMVIRYGYVAFFSKAFPLAALCVLLNNLIELRSDAYKFVMSHRRPVPVEKSGIGAWNGILRSLSYFGTAVNAFVMAFTSDWVSKQVYSMNSKDGSLSGYINSTLSQYATADYKGYRYIKKQHEFCYFRGHFYPPNRKDRYLKSQTYWMDLTFRFVTVFVFEHFTLVCTAILAYCISYEPESVKLQQNLNRQKQKAARLAKCERKLDKQDLDLSANLEGLEH